MKIPFKKLLVTGAIAAASITPTSALAGNGHGHGQGQQHSQSHHKVHNVTYVFKGTWNAATGTVTVKRGNAHVRKAGLVGEDVQFDLTGAKLVVADTNGDSTITADDLKDQDKVVVKARLPRKDPGTQPFKAKMLVDQTNPPAPDGSTAD
jgi:hypothetical protein